MFSGLVRLSRGHGVGWIIVGLRGGLDHFGVTGLVGQSLIIFS